MAQRALEHRVQDLERRVAPVEQILPTLATKAGVKADIQEAAEQTRLHFDVVAEGLRGDIRMIAEGVVSLHARVEAYHAEITGALANHARRLTRLETSRSKPA